MAQAAYTPHTASPRTLAEGINKLGISKNSHNQHDSKAERLHDSGVLLSADDNNHGAADTVCLESSGDSSDDGGASLTYSEGGGMYLQTPKTLFGSFSNDGGGIQTPPSCSTKDGRATQNLRAVSPVLYKVSTLEKSPGDADDLAPVSNQISEITVPLEPINEQTLSISSTEQFVPKRLFPFILNPGKMRRGSVPVGSSTKQADISRTPPQGVVQETGETVGPQAPTGVTATYENPPVPALFAPEHTAVPRYQKRIAENLKRIGEKDSLESRKAPVTLSVPQTGIRPPPGFGPVGNDGCEQIVPWSDCRIVPQAKTQQDQDAFDNQHANLSDQAKHGAVSPHTSSPLLDDYGLPVASSQYNHIPATYQHGEEAIHLQSKTTAFTDSTVSSNRAPRGRYHVSELLSLQETCAPCNFKYTTTVENLDQAADQEDKRRGILKKEPAPSWMTSLKSWRGTAQNDVSRLQQVPEVAEQVSGADLQPALPPFLFPEKPNGFDPTSQRFSSHNQSNGVASSAHQPTADRTKIARPFEPMLCLQSPPAAAETLSEEEIIYRLRNGISLNYKGQSHNLNNISHDIPHSENAAVWLTNLPPTVTVKELLGAIASHGPIGRIWSLHINPPKGGRATPVENNKKNKNNSGQMGTEHLPLSHRASAAKIIFCHPTEAQRLLALTDRGVFSLLNRSNGQRHQVRATHNRQRTPAQRVPDHVSRVLVIAGPRWLVSRGQLHGLFGRYFVYQTEDVVVLAEDEGEDRRVLEWRFGSMRAQAQAAYRLLKTSPGLEGIVTVRWGRDPCADGLAPVEELVSKSSEQRLPAGPRGMFREADNTQSHSYGVTGMQGLYE